MNQLKWLLVGAGNIARSRVGAALAETRGSELCAICDLDRERAEALAGQLGIRPLIFTGYREALAESGADAVYVATQPTSHVPLCLQALEAGKHFLCEKPLGVDSASCRELYEAAKRSPLVTSCSNYRRLSDQLRTAARLIREGRIGELTGGWMVYSANDRYVGNTPLVRALGGSPLKTLAFYVIDIVHNLFGMPSEVYAKTCSHFYPTDTEDVSAIVFSFPNGAVFTLDVIMTAVGGRHLMEFFGRDGGIFLEKWPPMGNGPVELSTPAGGRQLIECNTVSNYHIPLIEDFIAAVREGRPAVCSVGSAYRTECITDAVFRSAATGRPVTIEEEF